MTCIDLVEIMLVEGALPIGHTSFRSSINKIYELTKEIFEDSNNFNEVVKNLMIF